MFRRTILCVVVVCAVPWNGAVQGDVAIGEVTVDDDCLYPQAGERDYGLTTAHIEFSDATPAPGETITITAYVHNHGLCDVRSGWGWSSPEGRSCWGQWDFCYPVSDTVDISFRCRDEVEVDWRVELDGEHVTDVSVSPADGTCWKLVTIEDVAIEAGPHSIFLGTYQMAGAPDYYLDWVQVGAVRIEAETYDRMGGNDPAPDWRGVYIWPQGADPGAWMNLTVQIWEGDPFSGGTLLREDFIGPTNIVIDSARSRFGHRFEAHYIKNGGQAGLTCNWVAEPGVHDICVVVDPHDVLNEIDEDNNIACRSIETAAPPPPPPPPCFLAGTQITMADGSYANIEDVEVGDLVESYDVENGRAVVGIVTETFYHEPHEMADHYVVIDGRLRVTPNHSLYQNGGWVRAGDVKRGDQVGLSGAPITSVRNVYERVPTYDLRVEPFTTETGIEGNDGLPVGIPVESGVGVEVVVMPELPYFADDYVVFKWVFPFLPPPGLLDEYVTSGDGGSDSASGSSGSE